MSRMNGPAHRVLLLPSKVDAFNLATEFTAFTGVNGRYRVELLELDRRVLALAATLGAPRLEAFDAIESGCQRSHGRVGFRRFFASSLIAILPDDQDLIHLAAPGTSRRLRGRLAFADHADGDTADAAAHGTHRAHRRPGGVPCNTIDAGIKSHGQASCQGSWRWPAAALVPAPRCDPTGHPLPRLRVQIAADWSRP
jgi:hypothetical protein